MITVKFCILNLIGRGARPNRILVATWQISIFGENGYDFKDRERRQKKKKKLKVFPLK